MLYHVRELDRGLAELRRVLRPGGVVVVATNGDRHLATLLAAVGRPPQRKSFSGENGEPALRRYFADVDRVDLTTRAVFADHATAAAYLATTDPVLGATWPPFSGSRTDEGAVTIFTAR